jgi:fatty-acyl-CoA synthase
MSMNVGHWLDRWAQYTPEAVALVDDATGRRFSYGAFASRVERLAGALQQCLNVQPGDRVGILAYNSTDVLELMFAVARLGAIFVPVNYRLAGPEIAYILDDAGVSVLFYGPEFQNQVAALNGPALRHRVAMAENYELLLAAGLAAPLVASAADDPLVILYTSGTTGQPKGAILTHGSITWNATNTEIGWDLRRDDVALVNAPFFHTGGLNVLSTPLLHRGGRLVVMRAFDASRALTLIGEEGCTVVFGVPTMFQLMLESPIFAGVDLSPLRFAITGGAPCPIPLIAAYAARGVVFKQGYGLTEAGPNCFTLDAKDAIRKAGTVGFPNFYVDVRLVDETGTDVADGDVGELWVKGPHLFAGYWGNPEATAGTLQDGWLKTGDLVNRDDEGYFSIVDRKKDLIISGGENIYPAELERLLMSHPEIADVAVIGVPDAKWGEVGRAFVVLQSGHHLKEGDVLDFLSGRVARFKLPKQVHIVEALPRNAGGKVQKALLRQLHVTAFRSAGTVACV